MIKDVSNTIKNETEEQKDGFLSIFLGTLGASLLGKILAGKGVIRGGQGTIRARPILKLENVSKTNLNLKGYLSNNLPKIWNGAYVINLDEYKSIGTH